MKNKYFIKKSQDELYQDITTLFDGVEILKIEGFLTRGKPLNVYHQQWNNSQDEDYMVCSNDGTVIYENKDITISFIISDKYTYNYIDVAEQHERFINYLTSGDLYIKSRYTNTEVHVACLEEYKPTMIRLQRPQNYILGTINLHKLGKEIFTPTPIPYILWDSGEKILMDDKSAIIGK